MKYIITEQQLTTVTKKFNKEKADRGELGHAIEEMAKHFFKGPICDIIALKVNKSEYVLLILTPRYYNDTVKSKLYTNLKNFLGVDVMVLINHSQDCDDNI